MPRVTILLGKGGTGRTTIARALALNSARSTSTTLLHAEPSTQIPNEHVNNLSTRVVDPRSVLDDAVMKLIPLGPLTRTLLDNPAYDSLLEIAPGIKEAAVLNFLYGFLDRQADQIFLDGPATGHGLHFLEAPSKLSRVVTGKVQARLDRIDEMLKDPARTQVVLVALPEELPTQETMELAEKLDEQGFPIAGTVINRMPPPVPYETDKPEAPEPPSLGSASGEGIGPDQALALLGAQREEAKRWRDRLEGLPASSRIVPSLPGRRDLPREVAQFLEGFP